jgi:hypothetical protein
MEMTDMHLNAPSQLAGVTARLLMAATALRKRLRQLPAAGRRLVAAALRLGRATRLFGVGSVVRAFSATPLYWIRRMIQIAAPLASRIAPVAGQATGLLLVAGLARRPSMRATARLMPQLRLAGCWLRTQQLRVKAAFAVASRMSALRLTGVAVGAARWARRLLVKSSSRMTIRPVQALAVAITTSCWAFLSPLAAAGIAGLAVTSFLSGATRPAAAGKATATVVTMAEPAITDEVSNEELNTDERSTEELSKEELSAIYDAMLTVEDALPRAVALLHLAEETGRSASRSYATSLITDCQQTLAHLEELSSELRARPADPAAAGNPADELTNDIEALLTRLHPQLTESLPLMEKTAPPTATRSNAEQQRRRKAAAARSRNKKGSRSRP